MLERIAKLLALAEGAATPEEAEAAFAKAQLLASKHAIDLELARVAAAPRERQRPERRYISVGERGKRSNGALVNLYLRIAAANDVECRIAADSTYVVGIGMPSDLDACEALWLALSHVMVRFGDALVRDKGAAWRSETTYNSDARLVPVSAAGARRSFYDGFTSRIGERLREARKAAVAEVQASDAAVNLPSSMALVMVQKRDEVRAYEKQLYPGRARQWRGGGSSGTRSGSAHAAGRAAADRASLSAQRGVGA